MVGQSADKPQVITGDRHVPDGNVSPISLTQDWQMNGTKWEPLGSVSEVSLVKQQVQFKVDSTPTDYNILRFVYQLPEWSAHSGLPAAIYMQFSVSYPDAMIIDNTENWKCLIDASNAFQDGVSVSSVGSYINGWAVCYVMRIYGNLLQFANNLSLDIAIDAFFKNVTIESPSLGEYPINMQFSVSGESTNTLVAPNPASEVGEYGWVMV